MTLLTVLVWGALVLLGLSLLTMVGLVACIACVLIRGWGRPDSLDLGGGHLGLDQ